MTDGSGAPSPPARFGPWRREAGAFVELFAMAALVVAQPTFEIFGDHAEVFVERRVGTAGLVGFVALVLLGPPVAAWSAEVLVGLAAPRWRRAAHTLLLGAGVWFFTTAGLRGPYPHGHRLVVIGLAALTLFMVLWTRFAAVRSGLRYAAMAGPVFAVLFVFSTPVQQAVRPAAASEVAMPVRRAAPVVMVVFDEFPLGSLLDGRGGVDRALYPNFARLADTATWYRNTTTVSGSTHLSVPAMLTGRMPPGELVATAAAHPRNLFRALAGGHRLNVHETVTRLCTEPGCVGGTARSGRPLALWRTSLQTWLEFALPYRIGGPKLYATDLAAGDDHAAVFERFIDSLDADRRTFHFAHVMLPHSPWQTLPDGRRYDLGGDGTFGLFAYWWQTDAAAETGRLRHLLQVQNTDRLVGRMIDRLEALGIWDDAVVVVVADHGVVFRKDAPTRGATPDTYPEILWVPLFVKLPGQHAGRVDDRPARTVDLAPTIADALGARLPWPTDGRSLLGQPGRAQPGAPYRVFKLDELPGRREGEVVRLDRVEGFRQVLATRAAPAGTDPADPLRLYRLGPAPELVGRPVAPLRAGTVTDARATLDVPAPERLERTDVQAAVVPALIKGRVRSLAPGADLVVAVNGRVAGWASAYAPGDVSEAEFWVNVPPSLLRDGRNTVALYRLDRGSTGWELREIPVRR